MYVEYKNNFIFKKKRKIYLIASVSSIDDIRDRFTTSEEEYYSSIELDRTKSTTSTDTISSVRYRKGLFFRRKGFGNFYCA
jgi:hypothetical protein